MDDSSSRFFDELAKFFSGAADAAQGLREEIGNVAKAQAERLVADLDLVRREEFDVVREMASRARQENEALKVRLAELQAEIERLKKRSS